jgi:hypothetical protein
MSNITSYAATVDALGLARMKARAIKQEIEALQTTLLTHAGDYVRNPAVFQGDVFEATVYAKAVTSFDREACIIALANHFDVDSFFVREFFERVTKSAPGVPACQVRVRSRVEL